MLTSVYGATKPLRTFGGFMAMSLDTFVMMFRPPFAWREYVLQTWFVARVTTLPALVMVIPYGVLLTFTINVVLMEIGAVDYSGTGASTAIVSQVGPVATVLVISGAAATAVCADLGSRTIREELDALRVMGVDPIRSLVVPRVLAITTVSLALGGAVIMAGLVGSFVFSVYVEHVSPGGFVDHLTLLTGVGDVVVSLIKATLFGLAAGLIGCYKGITVGGGPAAVGNAVNETVVFSFVVLFAINLVSTAVGIQFTVS
ncbi:ABC transporter permease [Mycobacterium sp. 663a-19]|uniref:MlaE family ABC transporter permease n=1 Tax=Mycobacterium sp. 663a-19 TaxID=2986148 RepID=UPI002D1E5E7D|nr:ABC transporter permease [Mycobacterium sp. 663a-19]MEB3980780.1 ABC transporter permease [Mycobacterium sp. 663a-19]